MDTASNDNKGFAVAMHVDAEQTGRVVSINGRASGYYPRTMGVDILGATDTTLSVQLEDTTSYYASPASCAFALDTAHPRDPNTMPFIVIATNVRYGGIRMTTVGAVTRATNGQTTFSYGSCLGYNDQFVPAPFSLSEISTPGKIDELTILHDGSAAACPSALDSLARRGPLGGTFTNVTDVSMTAPEMYGYGYYPYEANEMFCSM